VKSLEIELKREDWREVSTRLRNISDSLGQLNQIAAMVQADQLAHEIAEAARNEKGVTISLLHQMVDRVIQGQFDEAAALWESFRHRPTPNRLVYRPGDGEYWYCVMLLAQGRLTEAELDEGYRLTVQGRSLEKQHRFLALRAEWLLGRGDAAAALEFVDQALQITRRTGEPMPGYLGLRALCLARLGKAEEALQMLQEGAEVWDGRLPGFPCFAAEMHLALGDREQARTQTQTAYRLAWADGPPYARWDELQRCRALLAELGEPEPTLPAFDAKKVPPLPCEPEIRAAIARLHAKRK
jgi:tetratricopeptide (TPR) repeat protein